jgi:hypothetical protein
MRTLAWLLAMLLPAAASADEVYLKSGGQLSGRIVNRTAAQIEVDIGAGHITVPVSQVVKIEEGRSALDDYHDRAAALGQGDAAGWVALGDWASAHGLGTQAREAYTKGLALAPEDARANAALGRTQIDGRWVSEEEGYRAKGYIQHRGEWVTPAEYEAMQRQEAASDAREHERQAADARAREAEARADEAEARAKEAAAQQQQSWDNSYPGWYGAGYGWGAGPVVWPTAPINVRPPGTIATRPARIR